jgi:hypothetical protein
MQKEMYFFMEKLIHCQPGKRSGAFMAQTRPDIVLLVHGTFSYRDRDEPSEPAGPSAWWQDGSEFVQVMDGLFDGRAICWPARDDAECRLPWTIGRSGPGNIVRARL